MTFWTSPSSPDLCCLVELIFISSSEWWEIPQHLNPTCDKHRWHHEAWQVHMLIISAWICKIITMRKLLALKPVLQRWLDFGGLFYSSGILHLLSLQNLQMCGVFLSVGRALNLESWSARLYLCGGLGKSFSMWPFNIFCCIWFWKPWIDSFISSWCFDSCLSLIINWFD